MRICQVNFKFLVNQILLSSAHLNNLCSPVLVFLRLSEVLSHSFLNLSVFVELIETSHLK